MRRPERRGDDGFERREKSVSFRSTRSAPRTRSWGGAEGRGRRAFPRRKRPNVLNRNRTSTRKPPERRRPRGPGRSDPAPLEARRLSLRRNRPASPSESSSEEKSSSRSGAFGSPFGSSVRRVRDRSGRGPFLPFRRNTSGASASRSLEPTSTRTRGRGTGSSPGTGTPLARLPARPRSFSRPRFGRSGTPRGTSTPTRTARTPPPSPRRRTSPAGARGNAPPGDSSRRSAAKTEGGAPPTRPRPRRVRRDRRDRRRRRARWSRDRARSRKKPRRLAPPRRRVRFAVARANRRNSAAGGGRRRRRFGRWIF